MHAMPHIIVLVEDWYANFYRRVIYCFLKNVFVIFIVYCYLSSSMLNCHKTVFLIIFAEYVKRCISVKNAFHWSLMNGLCMLSTIYNHLALAIHILTIWCNHAKQEWWRLSIINRPVALWGRSLLLPAWCSCYSCILIHTALGVP